MATVSRPEADCRLSVVPDKPKVATETIEISVIMPCLNEAETLEICITKAREALSQAEINGEIVIADNGSSDGSPEIAERMGARVVQVTSKGYGNALMGGIAAARGKYIVMGDADNSYNFGHIPRFLEQLRNGADVVMGNRFKGGIEPGAMPFLHKHLGNPVLSGVGKILFKSPVGDFHCGLRAFSKSAFQKMDLRTTGMEFASEMVVKASLLGLSIAEVPTSLFPDGRSRPPHLRTWRDGWRHLRFLLLYSPRWLFLYPGIVLMLVGAVLGGWLLPGARTVGHVTFDVHTLVYAAAFVLLGFQAIAFACFTKIFAISEGLLPPDPALSKLFRYITLEVGLIAGAAMTAIGLAASIYAVSNWSTRNFGMLDYSRTMRIVIPAAVFLMLGAQTIFASFFFSVLGMRRK
jgi:glycosyltransferase involved in cell wall biosynthesis